jgi:hypothetical protein
MPGDAFPRLPGTPDGFTITAEAPEPVLDPTLGVTVAPPPAGTPDAAVPLVALGDSITQGFMSLAVHDTAHSYPAFIADRLGLGAGRFRFPTYEPHGGLPLNLEAALAAAQAEDDHWWEAPAALAALVAWARGVEQFWTTTQADHDPTFQPGPGLMHNLAVFGYTVLDAQRHRLSDIRLDTGPPSWNWLRPFTPHADARAALRVFHDAPDDASLVDLVRAHADGGGIETLVIALGANNVLTTVIHREVVWSPDDLPSDDPSQRGESASWSACTPLRFQREWDLLMAALGEVDARHVLVLTVPHVTIVPLLHGFGDRLADDPRYFSWYSHVSLEGRFDPTRDRCLSGAQAREIDCLIDSYNDHIKAAVLDRRRAGRDWRVVDVCGMLDRLAYRRYLAGQPDQPDARPSWWDKVGGAWPLPTELTALDPIPDTRYLQVDGTGTRRQGGLFSLDGVHPSTVGYALVSDHLLHIMRDAGVTIPPPAGGARPGDEITDFGAAIAADSLLTKPPRVIDDDRRIVGWAEQMVDVYGPALTGLRGMIDRVRHVL